MDEKNKDCMAMNENPNEEKKMLGEDELNQVSGGGIAFFPAHCNKCGAMGTIITDGKSQGFSCPNCGTYMF